MPVPARRSRGPPLQRRRRRLVGQLVDGVQRLKKAAMSAVDFLEGQLKVKNVVFLPFPIMLIPIVNFYALINRPTAAQLMQLRKWFWQCALTLRYKAGTNRLVLEDISKIRKISEGYYPFDGSYPSVKSDQHDKKDDRKAK